MTLGQKIRARRLELNLSQDQLSEKSGVHQTTISDIENDITQSPQIETILALAKSLESPIQDLIGDEVKEEADAK